MLFFLLCGWVGFCSIVYSFTIYSASVFLHFQVADIFIYSALAWYFSQVWPSQVGVPKPFYFILQPSYWFPEWTQRHSPQRRQLGLGLGQGGKQVDIKKIYVAPSNSGDDYEDAEGEREGEGGSVAVTVASKRGSVDSGNMGLPVGGSSSKKIPWEAVNESLLGAPTVIVHKLRKTFGLSGPTVVNDLSFKMYENQIFALLGHNGAGKVSEPLVFMSLLCYISLF
jgi:ABC-type multidrug transport system fused ATPase/permease subunit